MACGATRAQDYACYFWPKTDQLFIGTCSFDAPSSVLDTTEMVLRYNVRFPHNEKDTYHNIFVLQYGRNYIKYENLPRWYNNLIRTNQDRGEENQFDHAEWRASGDLVPMMTFEIIRNQRDRKLKVRYNIPFQSNVVCEYEETPPETEWRISSDTARILGYACRRAEGKFRGREWSVWFTPEIPVQTGPWKLTGLPGLILEASDATGEFLFQCISIEQKREPILLYHWAVEKTTRKKWMKYERMAYRDPHTQFSRGGTVQFFRQIKGQEPQLLDASWTIPYYPLELE